MNIHSYVEKSKVNGPGERFVLWTQGCSKKCINCFNYNTWSFKDNEIFTPISIFEMVKNANCDGVTITGGDPLEQPEELLELLKLLYSLDLRKGIILFTGYTIDEINNLGGSVKECLGYIDLLIDGRFEDINKTSISLRGSVNQQFIYFSSKIKEDEVLFDQEVELHLRDDILLATGFPQIDRDFLLELGVILD